VKYLDGAHTKHIVTKLITKKLITTKLITTKLIFSKLINYKTYQTQNLSIKFQIMKMFQQLFKNPRILKRKFGKFPAPFNRDGG